MGADEGELTTGASQQETLTMDPILVQPRKADEKPGMGPRSTAESDRQCPRTVALNPRTFNAIADIVTELLKERSELYNPGPSTSRKRHLREIAAGWGSPFECLRTMIPAAPPEMERPQTAQRKQRPGPGHYLFRDWANLLLDLESSAFGSQVESVGPTKAATVPHADR